MGSLHEKNLKDGQFITTGVASTVKPKQFCAFCTLCFTNAEANMTEEPFFSP
jgi:hypothetical protein